MDLLLFDLPDFSSGAVWMSLLTLTFLEIVLGVDNIIFITLIANKLAANVRKKAVNIGLILAMVLRVALLFGIAALTALNTPFYHFNTEYFEGHITGQSLILIVGGIFLLYKSVTEIHHKLEGSSDEEVGKEKTISFTSAILQITIINIVFSVDSILTAVGMTSGLEGALLVMILAVMVSVLIMMLFAAPVGEFVNKHPTIQMLGLAFLILIGFMLIIEGAHLSHLKTFGNEIGAVPKGYLYFAIAFSLGVEFLNMKLRKKSDPIQLHGVFENTKK